MSPFILQSMRSDKRSLVEQVEAMHHAETGTGNARAREFTFSSLRTHLCRWRDYDKTKRSFSFCKIVWQEFHNGKLSQKNDNFGDNVGGMRKTAYKLCLSTESGLFFSPLSRYSSVYSYFVGCLLDLCSVYTTKMWKMCTPISIGWAFAKPNRKFIFEFV